MYMPPIIFDRNAHLVPIMVRVADLMWCGAGLSCFQSKPGRNGVAFPTAVYTIPLPLMLLVEGWDTDAGAIGEDMHMMLKCYFATNGRIAFESVPSPASQGNISSSQLGIRGWVDSHRARYTQGLRHMWGCLDFSYAFESWSKLGSTPPSLSSHKLSRHLGAGTQAGTLSATRRPRAQTYMEERYAIRTRLRSTLLAYTSLLRNDHLNNIHQSGSRLSRPVQNPHRCPGFDWHSSSCELHHHALLFLRLLRGLPQGLRAST